MTLPAHRNPYANIDTRMQPGARRLLLTLRRRRRRQTLASLLRLADVVPLVGPHDGQALSGQTKEALDVFSLCAPDDKVRCQMQSGKGMICLPQIRS